METSEKRKKAEAYILQSITALDKHALGDNIKRYKAMFAAMSDTQFDKYMKALRDNKTCVYMYMPNMTKRPKIGDLLTIAKKLGIKMFHRIKIYDTATDKYYLTNETYPIFRLPVRRLQQFLEKKISIPHGDSKIDTLTGQVAFDDRSAKITNPEIQALQSKGLNNTLHEFVSVRGGNIEAYGGEFKRQAEETGIVLLQDISGDSKTRSAVVTQLFLEGLMLETNLAGDF